MDSTENAVSTGLIVLISEQIIPALQGIWEAAKDPALRWVILLHTDDSRRSLPQAEQLETLCNDLLPPQIQVRRMQTGLTTQDVRDRLLDCRKAHPEVGAWIVNATGGIKLMTLGVGEALDERMRMVYSEFSARAWYEVTRQPDRRLTATICDPPAADGIDEIPVDRLAAAQFADVRFQHQPGSLDDARIRALAAELLPATRRLIDTDWNWRVALEGFVTGNDLRAGTLFEKYLAAFLTELGLTNLAWSLVTRFRALEKTDGEKPDDNASSVNENDHVVLRHGAITVLDLKLPDPAQADAPPSLTLPLQLRQASDTKRRLGGFSARWVMVRPCQTFTDDERALAGAYGVEALDATVAPNLLAELARLFGLPLTPALQAVHDAVSAAPAPFRTPRQPTSPRPYEPPCLTPQMLAEPPQNWWLAGLPGLALFAVARGAGDEATWRTWLRGLGIPGCQAIHTKARLRFLITDSGGALKTLTLALRPSVGLALTGPPPLREATEADSSLSPADS